MKPGATRKGGYRLRGESWTTSSHWIGVEVTLAPDDAEILNALSPAELQNSPRAIELLEQASGDSVIEVRDLRIFPLAESVPD